MLVRQEAKMIDVWSHYKSKGEPSRKFVSNKCGGNKSETNATSSYNNRGKFSFKCG
ncbi:hypothetical protein SLEP1_g35887 [Rubroshorea leprosula]|uniref:Uncharacterized protein n=1 Tax=Rubroshorea leprosula TaxID=152421 RepID=A0AAV5KPN9_9ROSI|nr:hypothetical protein SLEP1_g35887 [Rubroshorea leprosula]